MYISSDVDDWDMWFLGRAPHTRETLPDFCELCRVTRHSRVFGWLTGSQRTPWEWGVTDGSIDEPTDIQHAELHQIFSQLQLRGGAPDTSTTLIALPSPRRSSVLTMCFPDEIADYGGIYGVMSSDDYVEKLLQMVISQPEPDSALSYFCVLGLRDDEDALPTPDDDAITDDVIVDIASPDILGHVVGESNSVDPPLSFDVLSKFVSRSDDVLAFFIYGFEHFRIFTSLFY